MSLNQDPAPKACSHLDSHADTCAAGPDMVLLTPTDELTEFVDVCPFSNEFDPIKDIPIGTCATAWTDPALGKTVILVFHQTLYFGDKLQHSLLCPNQIRAYRPNSVEDCPRQFDFESRFQMMIYDEDRNWDNFISIPLSMDGCMAIVETHLPTPEELETCPYYIATSPDKWSPYCPSFRENEASYHSDRGLCQVVRSEVSFADNEDPNSGDSASGEYLYSLCNRNITEAAIEDDFNLLPRLLSALAVGDHDEEVYPFPQRTVSAFYNPCIAGYYKSRKDLLDNLLLKELLNSRTTKDEVTATMSLDEKATLLRRDSGPLTIVPSKGKNNLAASLASKWRIGIDRAKETLKVTTQKGTRDMSNPLVRRMKTQSYRNKRTIQGLVYSDTMKFKQEYPSVLRGYTAAQVFTNGRGFDTFYQIKGERQAADGLKRFIHEVGIPEHLVVDGAKAQGAYETHGTDWGKLVTKYQFRQTWIQPHSWWQNRAELSIAEIRKDIRYWTSTKNSPKRLWGYLGELITGRRQRTASTIPSAAGRTGFEIVHGYTPDITLYMLHEWYDPVYWYNSRSGDRQKHLGRWLGPCGNTFGGGDCYYVLTKSGKIHVTNTLIAVAEDDWKNPDFLTKLEELNKDIDSRIGDKVKAKDSANLEEVPPELFDDDLIDIAVPDDPHIGNTPIVDADDMPDGDTYDEYLNTKVMMQVGDSRLSCKVKERVVDFNGNPIGRRNNNPLLDSRAYHCEFPDGSTEIFTANLLAENLMSSVDDSFQLFSEILGYEKDESVALTEKEATYITKSGKKRNKPTTKGWLLRVQWKDGSSGHVKLSDMKDSFPYQTAVYARDNGIIDEPAFRWWAYHVLRRKKLAISALKNRGKYWDRTHKYGVELPKTIEQARAIDKRTNTDYWEKAIQKEMTNNLISFEFTDNDEDSFTRDPEYQQISVHMVFDVKLTGLVRKARLCADGHKVDEVAREHTYSSVPSRDSVRIFFLLAALNGLDVLAADIQNAYLSAPIKEKYYVIASTKNGFSEEFEGRPARIVRALYGLPQAGATFRSYLAKHLKEIGFEPCKADRDVHMRVAVKTTGEEYWEYVICYVDDILCGSELPQVILDSISGDKFKLKPGSVEVPKMYLGADISTVKFSDDPDGRPRWKMSAYSYTVKAIEAVEQELAKPEYGSVKLLNGVHTPITPGYRPETDGTRELSHEKQNYYQGLIGMLRWICELGRLDIIMPLSQLSRYLVQARWGHLMQTFNIFAYLKSHKKKGLVFDDTKPDLSSSTFHECDWSEYYPDAAEKIPEDVPRPLGKSVSMLCFVDADHAGCQVTRRSHSDVIIFVNRAPILWFSKRQTTVETSTFGSEIVALRIAIELIEGLRYKLRMMGVPLDGPTSVFCDNQSAVDNTTKPESPLKKKHNAIAYHKARESIAAGTIRIAKEGTKTNIADMLTKLVDKDTLNELAGRCMFA